MAERLQKILSAAGVASRRHAETLIATGRVTNRARRAILLHKPRGVVSTLKDPEGRPCLKDLLAGPLAGLFPVGRLDLQTTGLLLLTDDGALADALLRPRRGVERVYRAKVRGTPTVAALDRLKRGVRAGGSRLAVADVRVVERLPTKSWLEITVREGRWHLVRRACDAIRHPVEKLVRVRFGPLRLGALPPGGWREVTPREKEELYRAAGIDSHTPAPPAPTRVRGATVSRPRARRPRR